MKFTSGAILKLIALTVMLNLVRYFVIGFVEEIVIFEKLGAAMAASPSYFNLKFTTADWVTSYLYNFVMWLMPTIFFHKTHPFLRGSMILKSLKVYIPTLVVFLSISAIFMNHYSHPKDFYLYSMLDAVIVFPLVAVANGLLYPFLVRPEQGAAS